MRRTLTLAMLAGSFILAGGCSSSSSGPTNNNPTPDAGSNHPDAGLPPDNDAGDMPMDDGAVPPTEYDATLNGAEVVPSVITSSVGTAQFFLQGDGVTLTYDITQNVSGGTAAALHVAAPGDTAAVAYPITPFSGHMTGKITLSADDAASLANGMLYLDIQSSAHAGGELRGQLVTPGSQIFVAQLNADQELPPGNSTATGHASFIMNGNMDTVRYHFVTTATPTDINVHRGIGAQVGPVAFPFAPNIGQTEDGSLTLGNNDANDLIAGHWYVNVVTAANAAGTLRGQIIKPGEKLYTAVLTGANEVPSTPSQATGSAMVILSPDGSQVRYEIVVNGTIPTEADLDSGAAGQNGQVVSTLMLNATGAQGTLPIQPSQVSAIGNAMLYVNVKTASYPNGELRGQLMAR